MIKILRKNLEYVPQSAEETVQGQGYGAIWSNHGKTETPAAATSSETPDIAVSTQSDTLVPEA